MSFLDRFKSTPTPIQYTAKKHYTNFLYHNANDHIGKEIWDVDKKLREHHPFGQLHANERGALQSYSIGSSALSDELLQSHKANREPKQKVGYVHLPSLDNATTKFTVPKMTVFSGVKFDPGATTKHSNGIMYSPSFISSSIDPSVADEFAATTGNAHIMRIHLHEGHPGLYLGNDLNRSAMPSEHELLLPRGIHFKINPTPTVFSHNSPTATKHVWDAHVIPKGVDIHTWQPPKTPSRDFTKG